MKYYVIASYMGTMDEIPAQDTLEEAIRTRDRWNEDDGKEKYSSKDVYRWHTCRQGHI